MDLREALDVARQVTEHYRAFERIEAVLDAAAHAGTLAERAGLELAGLNQQIAAKREELSRSEAEVAALFARAKEQAEREMAAKRADLRALDEERASKTEYLQELQRRLNQEVVQHQARLADLGEAMATVRAEKIAADAELARTREKIDALLADLGKGRG